MSDRGWVLKTCQCAECRPFGIQQTFTRAEVLAFGERVREACAASIWAKSQCATASELGEISSHVRAVDVARLLEETP